MNASLVFFLLLFFLFTCHGEEQDDSPTSGIVAMTKAQKKVETPLEVSCPEPNDIKPCVCLNRSYLEMQCSNVEDEEQLRNVFSASFPSTNFSRFSMWENKGVKVLEDGVFGDVTFKVLEIRGSVLETVKNDSLTSSFSTLRTLIIESCQLEIFPFERLAEFTSLEKLVLSSNKIHSLPPLSSSSLWSFFLIQNPISHFPPDVFTLLAAVSDIYLDRCNLTEITPGTFRGLPKLSSISLSENKISYLQSLTFDLATSSPHEQLLTFTQNNIEFVEVDAFKGVPEFSKIVMENNALTTLEEEVWRPVMEKGIRVTFQGNSLLCGCDVAWLVSYPPLLSLASDASCANGTLLMDLDPADFDVCG